MRRQTIQVTPPRRLIEVMFVHVSGVLWGATVKASDHEAAVHEAAHLLAYARHHELAADGVLGRRTPESEWRVIRPDGKEHIIPPVRQTAGRATRIRAKMPS